MWSMFMTTLSTYFCTPPRPIGRFHREIWHRLAHDDLLLLGSWLIGSIGDSERVQRGLVLGLLSAEAREDRRCGYSNSPSRRAGRGPNDV